VENVKGKFTAQDSNGSVTAKGIQGDVSVDTSFSGVTLEGVSGTVRVANQNGGIDVTANSGTGCKDIRLKTSFSHLGVRVPANAGYKMTAHTSFGHINFGIAGYFDRFDGRRFAERHHRQWRMHHGTVQQQRNIDILRAP